MEWCVIMLFNDVEVRFLSDEKFSRIDIKYWYFVGVYIIIEFKKLDRCISFVDLLKQIQKYYRGMVKIFYEIG